MQNALSKAWKPHLYCSIPFFKMHKSIVFQFFHSLQLSKLRECLFKKLFSNCCGQLPNKEHLNLCRNVEKQNVESRRTRLLFCRAKEQDMRFSNLGHDLRVWLCNWVGPLYSNWIPPHLDLPTHKATAGLCCGLVVLILQETETTVLLLVIWLVVQYHLLKTLCKTKQ